VAHVTFEPEFVVSDVTSTPVFAVTMELHPLDREDIDRAIKRIGECIEFLERTGTRCPRQRAGATVQKIAGWELVRAEFSEAEIETIESCLIKSARNGKRPLDLAMVEPFLPHERRPRRVADDAPEVDHFLSGPGIERMIYRRVLAKKRAGTLTNLQALVHTILNGSRGQRRRSEIDRVLAREQRDGKRCAGLVGDHEGEEGNSREIAEIDVAADEDNERLEGEKLDALAEQILGQLIGRAWLPSDSKHVYSHYLRGYDLETRRKAILHTFDRPDFWGTGQRATDREIAALWIVAGVDGLGDDADGMAAEDMLTRVTSRVAQWRRGKPEDSKGVGTNDPVYASRFATSPKRIGRPRKQAVQTS
jgi:hypothetical protein